MKAIAMFPRTREVRLIDHPEPQIERASHVKLKMEKVGICGTDREIWQFKYGKPPPGSDYLITGHESLGRVVEVGSAVQDFRVGDTVVTTVRRPCPENCISCANGRPDFCYTGHFTERGIKGLHGYMAEYVVDEAVYMNKVPEALRGIAVLLEPLTIAQKALLQIRTIQSRLHWECRLEAGAQNKACRNALMLGVGPVGLLGAMTFRLLNMNVAGVARALGPNQASDILKELGASYYSTRQIPPADIARRLGSVDLVFEATGAAAASFEFMALLGANGIFVFTGVPAPNKDITIDAGTLMRRIVLENQVVVGTVNAPKEAFENGLRDLAEFSRRWPGVANRLITQTVPVSQFGPALFRRQPGEIKTVLAFS